MAEVMEVGMGWRVMSKTFKDIDGGGLHELWELLDNHGGWQHTYGARPSEDEANAFIAGYYRGHEVGYPAGAADKAKEVKELLQGLINP